MWAARHCSITSPFCSLILVWIWLWQGRLGALLKTQAAAGSRQPEPGPCYQTEGLQLVLLFYETFAHTRIRCDSLNSSKPDCDQEIFH